MGGTFFQPTDPDRRAAEWPIFREETFGPVAPLFRFKTEAEAIELANDTEFGLAAYFYSRDIGRIFRVAEALEYGMVGINEGLISTEVAPFGGVKHSGLGAKDRSTASRSISRSSTSPSAASMPRALSPKAWARQLADRALQMALRRLAAA